MRAVADRANRSRSAMLLLCGALACVSPDGGNSLPRSVASDGSNSPGAQRVQVGRFASRGLWTPAVAAGKSPALLVLPGSGAHGPEGMIPGSLTLDGRDAPLLQQFAVPFIAAGFNVLTLGKPGVEFFAGWDPAARVYDGTMLAGLSWSGLVDNAAEGLAYLRAQPSVDPGRIYVLGHSEGTQVATDLAQRDRFAGMILLGYSGEDLLSTVRWQLFEREISHFVETDLDADRDGRVTRQEAAAWTEFSWPWQADQEFVSVAEVAAFVRAMPAKRELLDQMTRSPFCADGICTRGPLYEQTARFPGPIFVFTGELDLQTRAAEALRLGETCRRLDKRDCIVTIVPGVQHAFSPPRPPRRHPVFDVTVGPVAPSFQEQLGVLARELVSGESTEP